MLNSIAGRPELQPPAAQPSAAPPSEVRPAPPRPLLAVEDLHISFIGYEGRAHVLAGVNLALYPGDTAALVGETGCGKSLLARAMMGLLPANARVERGRVLWDGEDVLRLPPARLALLRGRQMGMVFQDPTTYLNPVFTVGEQLMAVARRNRPGEDPRSVARAALAAVQIPSPEQALHRYPFQLSGGQRQRVLIALALLGRPRLLIADEPGTALDVSVKREILELLADLVRAGELTVLFISHDLGSASLLCRQVYVMYAGQIVEVAPTRQLFAAPLHPYTHGLWRSIPRLGGGMGEGIEGTLPDYTNPPPGCRFASRCPHRMPVCDEAPPPLVPSGPDRAVACYLHGASP